MKHVTFSDKSLLVNDEAADLLMQYAALVAGRAEADIVHLRGISSDGNVVTATFLLNSGSPLMAESTNSDLAGPDNTGAIEYMRQRISLLSSPPPVRPVGETIPDEFENLHL